MALIIGCGDMGIGSARALGRRHPLTLVDVNEIRLNECVERLRHDGYAVEGHSCDIVDAGQVEALGDALAKTASVCVLAHVAAIGNTPQGWQHLLDMDLLGAHRIARMAGQHMVRGGAVIFVSSTGSYRCPVSREAHALADDPFQALLRQGRGAIWQALKEKRN